MQVHFDGLQKDSHDQEEILEKLHDHRTRTDNLLRDSRWLLPLLLHRTPSTYTQRGSNAVAGGDSSLSADKAGGSKHHKCNLVNQTMMGVTPFGSSRNQDLSQDCYETFSLFSLLSSLSSFLSHLFTLL